MAFQTVKVVFLGVIGVFSAMVYVGTLRLRRGDAGTNLYNLFKRFFPVTAVVLLAGLGAVFVTVGRFDPIRLFGLAIDPFDLLVAGAGVFTFGLIGSMALLVLVGLGIDLQHYLESG